MGFAGAGFVFGEDLGKVFRAAGGVCRMIRAVPASSYARFGRCRFYFGLHCGISGMCRGIIRYLARLGSLEIRRYWACILCDCVGLVLSEIKIM